MVRSRSTAATAAVFLLAAVPLLAACGGGGGGSASPATTLAPTVATTVPPLRTTLPTTTLATTTTLAATTTTESITQYGAYVVQADLSLSPTPTALHQQLWELFRRVLGDAATAQYMEGFTVYYDPNRNADATLLDGQRPGTRVLMVNARYADDLQRLTRTFIHEYGHIITLSGDQVTPDSGGCGTTSVDEGCLSSNSYLNGFLNRFWWTYGQEIFDALASPAGMEAFYNAHPTDFVTRYAATDPLEDIAETWAEFVITDAPAGATVAEQKILFLWSFPALVQLRDEIRARVGAELGL